MTLDDTSAQSLAHWSEAGRAEMEAFYALATEDYRQLALAVDWPARLGAVARPGWRLLDPSSPPPSASWRPSPPW